MSEYIEREAVIAIIEEKQKALCQSGRLSRNEIYGTDRETFDNWQEIADLVDRIPAADVEPIRHGKWVYDPNAMDYNLGGWVCSLCGVRNNNIAGMPDIPPLRFAGSRYCPACGCRMDGSD